jgi:hypothetical protein
VVKKVLLSLLLVSSSWAQSTGRLDAMESAVRTQLGTASTYSVNLAINRAYRQVCTDYPSLEKMDTVYVDSADGGGALPSDFVGMASVNLLTLNNLDYPVRYPLWPLEGMSQDSVAKWVSKTMDPTDITDQKFYGVFKKVLFTYPRWTISGDSAKFEIRYYAFGTALSNASDTLMVGANYWNAVFYYSCAEVQARRGQITEATYYRNLCWQEYGPPDKQERVRQ